MFHGEELNIASYIAIVTKCSYKFIASLCGCGAMCRYCECIRFYTLRVKGVEFNNKGCVCDYCMLRRFNTSAATPL